MSAKGNKFKKPKPGEFIIRAGWCPALKPCKRGHMAPRTTNGSCAQCVRDSRRERGHYNETTRAWVKENRDHCNSHRREYNRENPVNRMISAARKTALKKNLPFDLKPEDIRIPECCPIFGIKLKVGNGARTNASPSIDRIVPSVGYVAGNVIVISWRANRIKNDASISELESILRFYKSLEV